MGTNRVAPLPGASNHVAAAAQRRVPVMRRIGLTALSAALSTTFGGHRELHAQTVIGPGNFTSTLVVDGQNATVVGPSTFDIPEVPGAGSAVVARNGASVTLDTTNGAISLTGMTPYGHSLLVESNAVVTNIGSGLSVTTAGDGQAAVSARGGARVALSDAQLTTWGGVALGNVGAYGISALGSGSTASLTRTQISTTGGGIGAFAADHGALTLTDVNVETLVAGDRSHGVNAQTAGRIDVTRGSIFTQAEYAAGIRASAIAGPGAAVTTHGTAVRTGGDSAHGAFATHEGAAITIEGGSVRTTGDGSAGLYAVHGATIAASGLPILTAGADSYGVYSRAGSRINLTAGSIGTSGDRAAGLRTGDSGSALNATDVTVITGGQDAVGASVFGGGSLSMTRGRIETWSDGAHGVTASDALSNATLQGTALVTYGTGAHTMAVWSGGTLSGTAVDANATGANSSALFLNGVSATSNGSGNEATAAFTSGSRLASDTGPTIAVAGGTGNVTLADSTVEGRQLWLRVGAGDAFSAEALRRMGTPSAEGIPEPQSNPEAAEAGRPLTDASVSVSAGSAPGLGIVTATRTRITGAAQTDAGSVSDVRLLQSTGWDMTGNSNLTRLTVDNSQITFTPPTGGAFKTLTVQDYHGNGGVLRLNTRLAGDGAPSDRLVVTGSATGQSRLQIVNAGGAGALTRANGIQVVEAAGGATTTTDAFALDGRVVAGAYEYRLFRGSADPTSPNSWYLRSEEPQPPTPPQPPEPPQPPQPPQPPRPLYRPEAGAYLANQRVTGQMFVHSLHDRLGEPQFAEAQRSGANGVTGSAARSGWLRAVGQWESGRTRDGVFDVDTDAAMLQGGAELAQRPLLGRDDRLHVGVMGAYVHADSDASARGNAARARGKVEGFIGGIYGTWYQNDENRLGVYADTWFQYGWFDNRVDGDGLPSVKYDSHGYAVSGELGYAMPLRGQWVVEPQAQLIYVDHRSDDVSELNGTRVSGGDRDGVVTRLGVRLHRTFVQSETRRVQPYLTLNWWHDDTGSRIMFDQTPVGGLYPSNRYEAKLGVNAQLNRRWTGWANVAGAWGEQRYERYMVRAGVKYTW